MSMKPPRFVCPQSAQLLQRVTGALLNQVNALCRKKQLKNVSGSIIKGPLSAIWLRSDEEVFYVEREMIPIFLVEESVSMLDVNLRR